MIKNNNRNSRDDKSKAGKPSAGRRTTSASDDKPKSRFGDKDEKEEKRKSGFTQGERSTKDFKPKTSRDGDSNPYSSRTSAGKDFKPRTDKDNSSRDYKPRTGDRDFKPREGGYKDFKSRGGRNDDFKPSAGSSRDVKPREGADSRPFRKREESQTRDTEFNRPERTVIAPSRKTNEDKGLIRLNRYISNAGICSRRKADELIAAGIITVNGEAVTELGHKVDPAKDEVR